MALTAKQQKQMAYMAQDYNTANGVEAGFTYQASLQASDTFALSEIANYSAANLQAWQNTITAAQSQYAPLQHKITAFS